MQKRRGWTSVMVVGLIVASTGCAHLNGEGELSETQANRLAERILESTPEYTHFAEGTTFSWLLLESDDVVAAEGLRKVVLDKLSEKYTVYLRESEVPDDLQVKEADGQLLGYRDGFRFSYRVELESRRTVKVHYSDWVGNLAASGHWKRYRWRDGAWQVVKKSAMWVS